MASKRATYKGQTFASKAEAGYYIWLTTREGITEIQHEPQYDLWASGSEPNTRAKVGTFKPDFTFYDQGHFRVVDVKGYKGGKGWTAFRLRAKIFAANYGTPVEVVYNEKRAGSKGGWLTDIYNQVAGRR